MTASLTGLGDRQRLSYIASQAADARVNVELETEGMTLNIGPQHPATHGTLRIICRLDGEQVVWAEPSAGYMHRGYEKLTEVRTFPQVTTLINRIDWLGSFANEVPFILAAEKLMDIEAPPRAQVIRTILFELSRIANVGLFLGDLGVQLGAVTPVFMAFRDREHVLNLIEGATGGRFHPNFDRIGGLKDDLPAGWIAETKQVMKRLRNFCTEMEDLLFGNEIIFLDGQAVGHLQVGAYGHTLGGAVGIGFVTLDEPEYGAVVDVLPGVRRVIANNPMVYGGAMDVRAARTRFGLPQDPPLVLLVAWVTLALWDLARREDLSSRARVLWAAGVQGSSFARHVAEAIQVETDRAGRIAVGPDLTIPGHPEIFVIGADGLVHTNAPTITAAAVAAKRPQRRRRDVSESTRPRPGWSNASSASPSASLERPRSRSA